MISENYYKFLARNSLNIFFSFPQILVALDPS